MGLVRDIVEAEEVVDQLHIRLSSITSLSNIHLSIISLINSISIEFIMSYDCRFLKKNSITYTC